jgi:hypothetical protein
MRFRYTLFNIACCMVLFLLPVVASAQSVEKDETSRLNETILHIDSLFWRAYNNCHIDSMRLFFTDDVEFYHDKGGLTTTSEKLAESMKTGLCGREDWRLRREVVPGTLVVYPLKSNGKIYGAIQSGEHVFYIREAGKKEYLDGHARFTNVWRNTNGEWKMARILSYDHGPAAYRNQRKEISLPASRLKRLAGKYDSPHAGVMVVTPQDGTLTLTGKSFTATVYPETETMFFMKERDLQFEFVEEGRQVTKIIVHEKGNKVEEAPRLH